jgi:uncharacterized protein YkwD
MKKIIVIFVSLCVLCAGVSADMTMQTRATTLVDLLEKHKWLTGEPALAYRSQWESILQIAVPQRPDVAILPFLYDAVLIKKQLFTYIPHRSGDQNVFLDLVNNERKTQWLSGLVYHKELNTLAQSYAVYLKENNHFSHTSLNWETLADRIQTIDYMYTLIGENLAKWYSDVAQVLQWWMDSPWHRANILEWWFVHMGLGRSGEYRVQLFGRPE